MPHEIRSSWTPPPWADNPWVVDEHGNTLTPHDFPAIRIDRIHELDLRPEGNGKFTFRNPCRTDAFKLRATQRQQLSNWLRIILVNCGTNVEDPTSWTNDRVYSVNNHPVFSKYEWRLQATSDTPIPLRGISLVEKWTTMQSDPDPNTQLDASIERWGAAVLFLRAHGSAEASNDLHELSTKQHGYVILAGHPAIHHGPTLLTGRTTYKNQPRKPDLRFALAHALGRQRHRELGLRMQLERHCKTHERGPTLHHELRSWSMAALLHRAAGETEYQTIFRYRLLVGALSLRGRDGEQLSCPHADCATTPTSLNLTHLLWTCPVARRHAASDWSSTSSTIRNPDQTRVAAATKTAWRVIQAVVPRHLWLHRNATAFQDAADSKHGIAAKIWATIANQNSNPSAAKRTQSETVDDWRCLQDLLKYLQEDIEPEEPDQRAVRLFYDGGGARGNPGTSGARSVLLEQPHRSGHWNLVWWAATYVGEAHTNNYAEHVALATGLQECDRRYGQTNTLIDIVGDSHLVTRQLQDRARVTKTSLRRPAAASREALRHLYDYQLHHTRRVGNKTADWLANYAMDTKLTQTWTTAAPPIQRFVLTELLPLTANDTAQRVVHP